jgi:hypothetical protein
MKKIFALFLLLSSGCALDPRAPSEASWPQEHEYGRPGMKPFELKNYERGDLEWMRKAKE